MNKWPLIKPRKPSSARPNFVEAATMPGPHPLDFLRSVMDGQAVEVAGEQYMPTRAEQRQAAQRFAAALTGGRDEEQDD